MYVYAVRPLVLKYMYSIKGLLPSRKRRADVCSEVEVSQTCLVAKRIQRRGRHVRFVIKLLVYRSSVEERRNEDHRGEGSGNSVLQFEVGRLRGECDLFGIVTWVSNCVERQYGLI